MSNSGGPARKMPRLDVEPAPMGEPRFRFDDPDSNLYDVVINVRGRKFYCSKMLLAKHSSFFYDMFYKDPKHTGQKEITLDETCSYDFDAFLKILHGMNELDEAEVHGVLKMAMMWKCGVAVQKCANFLKTCTLATEEKYHLAKEYGLVDLEKDIISNIKTAAELKTIVPKNLTDLDHPTMALLLAKSMQLHETCQRTHTRRIAYSPTTPDYAMSPSYSPLSPRPLSPSDAED